jgi:hypothetical protein
MMNSEHLPPIGVSSQADGYSEVYPNVLDSVLENVRSLSGLPRRERGGLPQDLFAGAVTVGSFVLSRWRLQRTR